MLVNPMLIVGDLNADPAVILCLSKGISAGRFIDLALACTLGELVFSPTLPVGSVGWRALVHVGISLSAVPMLLLLLMLVMLMIGGCSPPPLFCSRSFFVLMLGWPMLPVRSFVSLSGLHVGWILLIGPPRGLHVLSRMSGMFPGMSLGWFLRRLFLLLRSMLSIGVL